MPHLREAGTDSTGAETSEGAVEFLRTHLEPKTPEANAFYIDAPTIEILAEGHAPSLLINRLREILNRRGSADVEVIGAAPASAEESAEVIDRRARPEISAAEVTIAVDANQGADADAKAVSEEAEAGAVEGADTGEASDPVMVNGRQLKCVVCHETQFEHRRAPLHSAAASVSNVEGMGPAAECYICSACGYVHWFMR